jgi:hypothetical protein
MTPSRGSILVQFPDPRTGLRRSLSCFDVLPQDRLGLPMLQLLERFKDTAFPSARRLPLPTSFFPTGKIRFNPQ